MVRCAEPVSYTHLNQIVGAVYAYDYDTEQSELLEAFRHNLLIISLLIALPVSYTHLDVYKRQAWRRLAALSAVTCI